jgi:NhaP-type Na+/H+ or K+/H+ antiporter
MLSYTRHKHCFTHKQLSGELSAASVILLLCQMAKVIARKLPLVPTILTEPAICILAGMLGASFLHFCTDFTNFTYSDGLFVNVLLPPIIFESALSIDKRELKHHQGTIFMISYFGPIISTFTVGLLLHFGSGFLSDTNDRFPLLDALVFASAISSTCPLSNIVDPTIHTLLYGESVFSDATAISLFQILVAQLDFPSTNRSTTTTWDEALSYAGDFLIVIAYSILIGLLGGCGAYLYFSRLDLSSPAAEVGCLFLWALLPGYISAGNGMSGLISVGTAGFFMDIFIAGPRECFEPRRHVTASHNNKNNSSHGVENDKQNKQHVDAAVPDATRLLCCTEEDRVHLSPTANKQVRFVAYMVSRLCEDTMFAYLGVFLVKSNRSDWDLSLVLLSIGSCLLSRLLMVFVVSTVVVQFCKWFGFTARSKYAKESRRSFVETLSDPGSLFVLVLAGLRGTVSLALIENVPIYNEATGEGSEFKQIMKGMTVASILFTIFVIGGSASCVFPLLGHHTSRTLEQGFQPPLPR